MNILLSVLKISYHLIFRITVSVRFPCSSNSKEFACNAGDLGVNPWIRKIIWRREWESTPVQLSCLENPMDWTSWWAIVCGFAELEMTERLTIHFALTYQSGSYYHLCFSDGKIEIQNGESACHHIQLLNCIFRIQT